MLTLLPNRPVEWPTIPGVLDDELDENPFKNANKVFVP
jgi:hypothetical protein